MSVRHTTLIVLLAAVLALSGCLRGSSDTLIYNGPTEQTVKMGDAIPGSDIRYVEHTDAGAVVMVGGQRTTKKVGDSLDWESSPLPGVDVSMAQRILAANEERLQTVGTVKVSVDGVRPAPAQFPDKPAYSYKVAVTYTVRKGDRVPGTLITYRGKSDQGAEFEGVSGIPYRKLGDSLSWTGQLRNNVYLDMTSRVTVYADDFVTLVGLATIGLTG